MSVPPVPPRAVILACLTSCLDACTSPVRVVIQTPDGAELAQFCVPPLNNPGIPQEARGRTLLPSDPPSPPVPMRRDPRGLWDVRRALADADPVRLTLRQLLDALSRDGLEWSERQVARWLAVLVDRGEVDNHKNDGERGTGYGFTHLAT